MVANDDGGSIFATLEQGAPEHAASYDQLFGTPHGVDLASLCAATRTPHWRVSDRSELEHALASPNGGIEVVEAVVRRDNRRELDAPSQPRLTGPALVPKGINLPKTQRCHAPDRRWRCPAGRPDRRARAWGGMV